MACVGLARDVLSSSSSSSAAVVQWWTTVGEGPLTWKAIITHKLQIFNRYSRHTHARTSSEVKQLDGISKRLAGNLES
jgi:hypothetical protein